MSTDLNNARPTPPQILAQMQAQSAAILAEGMVLTSFQHKGIAGIEREQPIRRFLAIHLPSRFLVGQGSIASADVILGNQHDIIVADRDSSFALLNTVSAQLLTIESVHLIVEVRTSFGELDGVGKSLRNVRGLRTAMGLRQLGKQGSEVGFTAPPVHSLVVYQGPTEETALKHLRELNATETSNEKRMALDSILVLARDGRNTPDSGYLIGYARTDPKTGQKYDPHYYPFTGEPLLEGPKVLKSGADAFAHWYAGILNHLSGVVTYPPILYAYLGENVGMSEWTDKRN